MPFPVLDKSADNNQLIDTSNWYIGWVSSISNHLMTELNKYCTERYTCLSGGTLVTPVSVPLNETFVRVHDPIIGGTTCDGS